MLDTKTFIERAREVHGDFYDYSKVEYTGVRDKVIIQCPKHGEFKQNYELHVRRKKGCNECGIKKQRKTKRISAADFVKRACLIHKNKYTYPNIGMEMKNGLHDKITIVCPIHGEMKKVAYSHLHDGRGCSVCASEKRRLTTEQFIEKSQTIFGDFYGYELTKYQTNKDLVTITCPNHGSVDIPPRRHYKIGCYECKKNRLEDQWLDSMGVPNDGTSRQVRLDVTGRLMVVDGFNPNTNTVYLFHGDFWHGNPLKYDHKQLNPRSNKTFGELYSDTLEYEQHLRDNGYIVVVEWESDFYDKNDDTKSRKQKQKQKRKR